MRVQKIIRAQGEYAKKGEDIKDGDLVTILDEGQMITGDYGDRMVFKIETRNGDKNLSFNQRSMNNLIDAFGDDTANWKNKQVKIWMVKAMVSGKFQNIVYLADSSWMMAEDGSFYTSNKSKNMDIPIVNEEEETQLKDVPF